MTCRHLSIIAAAAVLVLVLADDEALACSCVQSGPPCQAAWSVEAVFAGKVRAIERIDEPGRPDAFLSVRVTFDVEQGYISAPAARVEVTTGSGGGDCGYRFTVGKRYLVYASRHNSGGLVTGICSRTRPIEQAGEDLEYLKTVPASATGARVYGRVNEWRRDPAEERGVDYGPLEGLTVSLLGATFQTDVTTDAHGRFEIAKVPVGKATLSLLAPLEFDPRYLRREIEITDPRACSLQNFTLTQAATASGTVVDGAGRPVAGVAVDAVAAELAGFDPPPYQYPVRTDQRGAFKFEGLPPGIYVFGINLTTPAFGPKAGAPVFLPGVGKAGDATVVELRPNEEKDVGVLKLPR
jgi:hypothetical protein